MVGHSGQNISNAAPWAKGVSSKLPAMSLKLDWAGKTGSRHNVLSTTAWTKILTTATEYVNRY